MTVRQEPPTLPGYEITREGQRWIAQHLIFDDIRFTGRNQTELDRARSRVLAREVAAFDEILAAFTPGGYLKRE